MKPVKNLLFALLLVFAVAANTLAGDIPIPPAAPTPSPNAILVAPEDGTSSTSDPYAEQSGETVDTSDYLLFETVKALLLLY